MTLDEAQKLADIISTADGGCSDCVGDLIKRLNDSFPTFVFEVTEDDRFVAWPDDMQSLPGEVLGDRFPIVLVRCA